jgi:hypothetical protein
MYPICRDFRLEPGQGFAWSYEDRRDPAPRIVSGVPWVSLVNSNRGYRPRIGAFKMQRRIRPVRAVFLGCLTAVLATLSFAGSASAKITGCFTKFQHFPQKDSEANRVIHIAILAGYSQTQDTFRQLKELLNKFLLGVNCYFGSITKTVRGSLQTRRTNQTDLGLLSGHNPITGEQPITEQRTIGNHRFGIEPATRKTNGLTSLTLSTA